MPATGKAPLDTSPIRREGNILTSAQVLEHAGSAFEAAGCDLAEHLMLALEAGARGGEGDSRCAGKGIPSDSAFLEVESPALAEGDYLSLHVESSGEENPLPLLRAQLQAWRALHPCSTTATANPAVKRDGNCSCRFGNSAASDAVGLLLGGLLIVAWRRKRATRQLRPIQAA